MCAPTDNGFGNNIPDRLGIWCNAHANRFVKQLAVSKQDESGVAVKADYPLEGINVPYIVTYHIQNDGAIKVTAAMDMTGRNLPELPRFCMRMHLPAVTAVYHIMASV